jgi:hypothetical protein
MNYEPNSVNCQLSTDNQYPHMRPRYTIAQKKIPPKPLPHLILVICE